MLRRAGRAIIAVVDTRAIERRARMTTTRHESAVEADAHDLAFWQQMPPAERVLQVWKLSQEQWRLGDGRTDESGLCRSVASVRRG